MSDGQFTSPFIVKSDGEAIALKRVSFAGKYAEFNYDEDWLQHVLFSNPASIPVQEIDTAYQRLVPICTELNTPVGPLDVLYATPEGKLVILEAKLWRNPEARRKVISQILDYAKELNRWDYEELQKQVSRRLSETGNALYSQVKAHYPDTDESEFVDGVSRSLRTGQFMLLIVGDGIREGAGAIAQFLDDVGHLQFSLGLIEVGIYETPQENVLVQPRILAKTMIINRTVIELASPEIKIQPSDELVDQNIDVDSFYQEFWLEFINDLKLDDITQRIPNPAKAQSQFFALPPSGDNAWINVYFAGSMGTVGVYFKLAKNEFGEMAYEILEKEKSQILSELPEETEWTISRGFHTVGIKLTLNDVKAPENRTLIKHFFTKSLNAFINSFRTRMETIVNQLETS
ncbi:DUF4268 domain-containing protein [Photobacterium sp. MCCC 1A19761]|uniref:DUF4268 domain-containing protein n=1 Tax=Photobacterium sp. MCCC 1A19761 TaxID=3115000 RepID=UPI00307E3ABF